MSDNELQTVTIIYYNETSLELQHEVCDLPANATGRVIIPDEFKVDKSIIAVCQGDIRILNKMGDRIVSVEYVA
jgi:uncharacterized protein (TIGR02922 family)